MRGVSEVHFPKAIWIRDRKMFQDGSIPLFFQCNFEMSGGVTPTLGEIGAAYEVGESPVAQASRRVAEEMKQSELVRKSVEMLERELGVSKV